MNYFVMFQIIFMIFSVVICNCFTVLLLKYHSTILYINRNIFIYLNVSLIINISMMVNEQSMSFILKLFFGSLPFIYAFIARTLITTATLLYFGIILNLSFFRILLIIKVNFHFLITIIKFIFKPAAFHNLKHEKTFRIIFGSILLTISTLLSTESLYRFKYIKGKSKRNSSYSRHK